MRCLLCGFSRHDVKRIVDGMKSPNVLTVTTPPFEGALSNVLPEHKLLVHVVSAMNYLSVALKHAFESGAPLLAYDVPIIETGTLEQAYLPREMSSWEMDVESLSTCQAIIYGVYMASAFDYVFRLGGSPDDDVLVGNGILDIGDRHVVDVGSWSDVAAILSIEGA